jgi:hypothetical protein
LGVEALIPKQSKNSDENKVQQVPIGYKFEENFPTLPGSENKINKKKVRGK